MVRERRGVPECPPFPLVYVRISSWGRLSPITADDSNSKEGYSQSLPNFLLNGQRTPLLYSDFLLSRYLSYAGPVLNPFWLTSPLLDSSCRVVDIPTSTTKNRYLRVSSVKRGDTRDKRGMYFTHTIFTERGLPIRNRKRGTDRDTSNVGTEYVQSRSTV